jgi:Lipocalin-like domain
MENLMNNFKKKTVSMVVGSIFLLTACNSATDPLSILTGSSQKTWVIKSRIENGGTPGLPTCAKDDTLTFKNDGKFDSLIAGTKCNPAETDVQNGDFTLSEDQKVITFAVPGFSYKGTLLEKGENQIVIEFDFGAGFKIQDTFTVQPKGNNP